MASASASAAPPSNEEDAIKLIKANPEHYIDAFNILKKQAARRIMGSQGYKQDPSIEALESDFMPEKFMTWYYDNNPESECPIGKLKKLDFTGFKKQKLVSAMELVKSNNKLRPATTLSMGGRKKRSRTNRRSRIRRQKRRTSRRY